MITLTGAQLLVLIIGGSFLFYAIGGDHYGY